MPPTLDETLDPADWEEFRDLGHRMIDQMVDFLSTLREQPAWQPVPEEVRSRFRRPLPRDGEGEEQAYRDFVESVLPYGIGNVHPRFWGWVNGSGAPIAVLAELLAATLNTNSAGSQQGSTWVEYQVLDWLKEMLGFPAEASGLLLSGGSMANLVGLAVARNAKARSTEGGVDVRRQGLIAVGRPMVCYAAAGTHSSVSKAVEMLGLGGEALRQVPVDERYRLDLEALRRRLVVDRQAGCLPFAVIGNAGTTDTGAVDDLAALADLCAEEDLWLHVDGAFGAMAALALELKPLVRGMERADSLAFDLHKWMYLPYEVGCTLVRDAEAHRAAFETAPAYLAAASGGIAALPPIFANHGVQLSRGFRALKVWMAIKTYGADKYGRMIAQNVAQIRSLAAQVDAHPSLEVMAPVSLNVLCFRYVEPGLDNARLDELNARLVVEIQESGFAVTSSTVLGERFVLRVAINNHRTRREDLDRLVEEVVRRGAALAR